MKNREEEEVKLYLATHWEDYREVSDMAEHSDTGWLIKARDEEEADYAAWALRSNLCDPGLDYDEQTGYVERPPKDVRSPHYDLRDIDYLRCCALLFDEQEPANDDPGRVSCCYTSPLFDGQGARIRFDQGDGLFEIGEQDQQSPLIRRLLDTWMLRRLGEEEE